MLRNWLEFIAINLRPAPAFNFFNDLRARVLTSTPLEGLLIEVFKEAEQACIVGNFWVDRLHLEVERFAVSFFKELCGATNFKDTT